MSMTVKELHDRLEDDNQHNLVALLVAVAAEQYEVVVELGKITERHLASEGMTQEDCSRRYELTKPLYQLLRQEGIL